MNNQCEFFPETNREMLDAMNAPGEVDWYDWKCPICGTVVTSANGPHSREVCPHCRGKDGKAVVLFRKGKTDFAAWGGNEK